MTDEPLMELRIDDAQLKRALKELGEAAEDGRKPLLAFYSDWKAMVTREWGKVRVTGGTFRGDAWAAMKPQRYRADGTPVPAWGGIPKVRGRGNVKGKLRPGRKDVRIKPTNILNKDTGTNLQDKMLATRPDVTKSRLRIGGGLPEFAEHVFVDLKRNPLKFKLPDDERMFVKHGLAYVEQLARKFNR